MINKNYSIQLLLFIIVAVLFPVSIFAQQEIASDTINNNDDVSTLIRQLSEKQKEIDLLNDSIKRINAQMNDSIQKYKKDTQQLNTNRKLYQDSLSHFISENQRLMTIIQVKNDSLKLFGTLDNMIYKQCLLFPLERRYNPIYINDCKKCLAAMRTDATYPKDYKIYYHFLDEYATFNQEIIGFLKEQEENLSMKNWKINEIAISQAQDSLKGLHYYQYYRNCKNQPWESILYLDETLDEFFKRLNSGKLNAASMKDLIQRLEPKK